MDEHSSKKNHFIKNYLNVASHRSENKLCKSFTKMQVFENQVSEPLLQDCFSVFYVHTQVDFKSSHCFCDMGMLELSYPFGLLILSNDLSNFVFQPYDNVIFVNLMFCFYSAGHHQEQQNTVVTFSETYPVLKQ